MVTPESTTQGTTDGTPPMQRRQLRVVVVAIMLCSALGSLDLTIVSTAAPTIVGELHGVPWLSWLFTVYIIVSGITTPLYGKLADLYGSRRLYIFAISAFLLGSALSGLAQSMPQLIAFRAVQGVGAGGITVLTMTVIGEIVPLRDRGRFMGMFGAVLGGGAVAGPLLGGVLTDQLTWRWIFYINLPLGLIALVAIVRALKPPPRAAGGPVDYLGFVLLAAATAAITLVTSWGGGRYAWSSPVIVVLGAASAVLLVLFVLRERVAPEPLVPLRMFRARTVTFANLGNVAVHTWATVIGAFLPMFVQFAIGFNATNSGLLQLPIIAALMLVSAVGGGLITRWRRYKWAPVLGTALGVGSLVLFAGMTPHTSAWLVVVYMAVFGIAIGLCMQPLMLAIQATAPREDLGAATATGTFSQRIGGSVGFAALAAFFSTRLDAELTRRLPADTAATVPRDGSIAPAQIDALDAPLRAALRAVFADTISDVFVWTIPVVALGFVCCLLLKDVRLDDDIEVDM